ncbi:MAG: ABC transporter ATP-binding protein [Lautropia sp.]
MKASQAVPAVDPAAAPYLEVRALGKRFGATPVLNGVSFGIEKGEFVCFLGPSGCGKTTLLLCLAGLEEASSGQIFKAGVAIEGLPPSQRDVGIVFQSYALFPNLTVADNVAFGLVSQRRPAAEIRSTVADLIALLSLQGHEKKFPSQLSGGQQQRVALARALALSPSLLLLDEPLSALDAQVRARLRGELRELQTRLGLTTLMVTHDQEEAQSLSDRIVLMNQGRIEQVGTPWALYNEPVSAFVADFVGTSNLHRAVVQPGGVALQGGAQASFIACDVSAYAPGQALHVLVRPEDVALVTEPGNAASLRGVVHQVEYLGAVVRAHLRVGDALRWVADVGKRAYARAPFGVGDVRWLNVRADDVKVFA